MDLGHVLKIEQTGFTGELGVCSIGSERGQGSLILSYEQVGKWVRWGHWERGRFRGQGGWEARGTFWLC